VILTLIAGFLPIAIAEWVLPRKNACAHLFSLVRKPDCQNYIGFITHGSRDKHKRIESQDDYHCQRKNLVSLEMYTHE
jgi:hypothetical protein